MLTRIKIVIVLLVVTFLGVSSAYAHEWRHSYRHSRHFPEISYHYPYGHARIVLPSRHLTVVFDGCLYHYDRGVFYRQVDREYVVVPPPSGAEIVSLPSWARAVRINGDTYYTADGIYYQKDPQGGYVIVPRPSSDDSGRLTADHPVSRPPTVTDAFTVNVPNAKGGYTAVTLKKSGDGFVGPQGEFYTEFPPVEQLRVMYGT